MVGCIVSEGWNPQRNKSLSAKKLVIFLLIVQGEHIWNLEGPRPYILSFTSLKFVPNIYKPEVCTQHLQA